MAHTIDVVIQHRQPKWRAIVNIIETNIPTNNPDPEDLTTEESYGNNVSAQEFRLNLGGGITTLNIDKGARADTAIAITQRAEWH